MSCSHADILGEYIGEIQWFMSTRATQKFSDFLNTDHPSVTKVARSNGGVDFAWTTERLKYTGLDIPGQIRVHLQNLFIVGEHSKVEPSTYLVIAGSSLKHIASALISFCMPKAVGVPILITSIRGCGCRCHGMPSDPGAGDEKKPGSTFINSG